jgi:hypothetical protein
VWLAFSLLAVVGLDGCEGRTHASGGPDGSQGTIILGQDAAPFASSDVQATGLPPLTVSGPQRSNLPGATFTVTKTVRAADLELLSSYLYHPTTSPHLKWFGELRNNGPAPACQIEAVLVFKTADGMAHLTMRPFVVSNDLWDAKTGLFYRCIPPGESAVLWDYQQPVVPMSLPSVGGIEATLDQEPVPGVVPHPSTPLLGNIALALEKGSIWEGWVLRGTLTAGGPMHSVSIDGFYRNAEGLVVAGVDDFKADADLELGATWDFSLTSFEGRQPSSWLLFVSFVPGIK